jgi:hypothetical protein
MLRSRTAPAFPAHAWLFDLLFTRTPTVTWAVAGALPAGFERTEQFAVLRAGGGRSFTVSLAARHGTSSALTSYNALRSGPRRLARRVLGLGLRTGLAQPLLRHKIDIGTASGTPPAQLADDLLGEHLQQLLGHGPVVVAIGGGGGPYRKPVLQVFSTNGTPLGYVKVGWNDWTREAVRREAAALRACALRPMRVGVPELLGQSMWRGLDLLVTAPLPQGIRRLGTDARLPDVELLREISGLSAACVGELADSPWWLGLRARIQTGVTDPETRSALAMAAERIERAHGRVRLEFGTWHGDLVPWNLARLGHRLYAWDWETSTPDAPLGFDALHFHFQVAFVARHYPLEQAVALAARRARPALEALGIPADPRGLLALLHLVELSVRHEEARSSTGDVDDRFYPAVTRVLERALALPSGLAGPDSAGRAA